MAESKDGNVQNSQREKLSCSTSLCINVFTCEHLFSAKLDIVVEQIIKLRTIFQFFGFNNDYWSSRISSEPNWHPNFATTPTFKLLSSEKLEKNFPQHGRQHNSKMRKTQGKVFVSMRRRRKFSNYAGKVSCAMLIKVQSQSSPLALTWGSRNFCEKLIKVLWSEKLAWNVKSYSGSRGRMEWRGTRLRTMRTHESKEFNHFRNVYLCPGTIKE